MPPATFIAVQCFQCSTMQVKQQKKSSNRWVCVVCNQKQSVRKVFAQSSMARDVRKVVQTFNMARQLSEEPEPSDPRSDDDERKSKRNDWSEYVDDRDEWEGNFGDATEGGDNGVEAMVVTEMPKALFKKPKLKDYSSSGYGTEKMFKPVFPNRNAKRNLTEFSQETQSTGFEKMSYEIASKKSDCSNEGDNRTPKWKQMEEKFVRPSTKGDKGSVSKSKWSSFITEEEDEDDYDSLGRGLARGQPIKGDNGSVSKSTDCIAGASENNNAMGRLQHTTAAKGLVSKWSSFITEEDEEDDYDSLGRGLARGQPIKGDKGSVSKPTDCITGASENNNAMGWLQRTTVAAAKGLASKWSSFITEEDEEDDYDGLGSGRARDLLGRVSQQIGMYPMETLMNDDKVDEDVHPDFL